jgi:response regulator RpfG family c-di-GMP phosphodiesterase
MSQDAFLFAPEAPATQEQASSAEPWVILSVDDEPSVHEVTKLALSGFKFDNRPIVVKTAASGVEAMTFMAKHKNVAMVLLDIVMESDNAGLGVARYIREVLKNNYSRIVLRTGQPGQAPEDQVIRDYDIDGYVEKTELVRGKLHSLLYSTLRSYRDIVTIQKNRKGLKQVIDAITSINDTENLTSFASAVLNQLAYMVPRCSSMEENEPPQAYALAKIDGHYSVLAASYQFKGLLPESDLSALPEPVRERMQQALSDRQGSSSDQYLTSYHRSKRDSECVLYISGDHQQAPADRKLMQLFANNIVITYEALLLKQELSDTQLTLVNTLGEAVESRSKETASHVNRVGEYSALLAQLCGIDEATCQMIKIAAPLHDIGKIAIPDRILNKPGSLDAQEWLTMKCHSERGYDILKKSDKPLLQLAATIAHQHHEHWDGNGYPQGLAAEAIDRHAHITAVADVFDALCCKRCYKDAIAPEKALEILKQESGTHFDPALIELFEHHFDQFLEIRSRYPD